MQKKDLKKVLTNMNKNDKILLVANEKANEKMNK